MAAHMRILVIGDDSSARLPFNVESSQRSELSDSNPLEITLVQIGQVTL